MLKPDKQMEETFPKKGMDTKPKRRCGRPEKATKIEDTPLNVARAMWGERSTKFPMATSTYPLSNFYLSFPLRYAIMKI